MVAALCMGMLAAVQVSAENSLPGYGTPPTDPPTLPDTGQILFKGDLVPELGIGCSNTAGTSGGPNDVAQGVEVDLPCTVTSHWYYIFTQVSPNITALSFVAWLDIGGPDLEFYRQAGLDWGVGSHTEAINNLVIPSASVFIGHNQPQTNVGMRWGVDSSSGDNGKSYIRAPSCGASTFFTLASLGFPGQWTWSATCRKDVPVELTTWGAVKDAYK
jgi:hypothetical protein